jgi:membrane-bound lytic murein transglycosylase A
MLTETVMRRPIRLIYLALALLVSGVLAPIVATADPARARPVPAPPRLLLDDGDVQSLREAVTQSLTWIDHQPPERRLVFGPVAVTAAQQARGLRRLLELLGDEPGREVLIARILAEFDLLKSVGGPGGEMLVTGYYEPVIDAAETESPEYPVPILGVPDDLVEVAAAPATAGPENGRVIGRIEGPRIVPYWNRAEITAGRLARRGRVVAWARDPVDVFFMEIEGSGTLRFPDGRELRLSHATTNGRPYRSIGRLLINEGKIEREAMSMPAIRAWLAANPADRARVLHHNESYVFFRYRDSPPVGSFGAPLTPGRSIATDARLFPPGALAFVRTERPTAAAAGKVEWTPVSRFVLNQDTGGAIRGPGRVDVFWGRGVEAELAAGLMKQPGELYFLVPKNSHLR